jgi:hypothetical protein
MSQGPRDKGLDEVKKLGHDTLSRRHGPYLHRALNDDRYLVGALCEVRGDSEAVYLEHGAVLSRWFVEPDKRDQTNQIPTTPHDLGPTIFLLQARQIP